MDDLGGFPIYFWKHPYHPLPTKIAATFDGWELEILLRAKKVRCVTKGRRELQPRCSWGSRPPRCVGKVDRCTWLAAASRMLWPAQHDARPSCASTSDDESDDRHKDNALWLWSLEQANMGILHKNLPSAHFHTLPKWETEVMRVAGWNASLQRAPTLKTGTFSWRRSWHRFLQCLVWHEVHLKDVWSARSHPGDWRLEPGHHLGNHTGIFGHHVCPQCGKLGNLSETPQRLRKSSASLAPLRSPFRVPQTAKAFQTAGFSLEHRVCPQNYGAQTVTNLSFDASGASGRPVGCI